MFLEQPAVALDRVRLELQRIGDKTLVMIRDSLPTLTNGTRERIQALEERDQEVDSLTDAVILYLRELSTRNLVDPQPARLQRYLGAVNYLENIADVIETGMVSDSRKRLKSALEMDEETEAQIRDVYKELYQAAQLTVEALVEDDADKARQVMAAKSHFNGLSERVRSGLYTRLKSERPEHLALYKIETGTIENLRRIHNLLRRICKLIVRDPQKEKRTAATEPSGSNEAENPDKPDGPDITDNRRKPDNAAEPDRPDKPDTG
jgi:phosphate:Na+ symporter